MNRSIVLMLGILMATTIVPTGAQGNGVEYVLIIDCPDGNSNSCPIRAEDPEDMMGDPSLAIDPFDPDRLIMASLHGLDAQDGPSDKSRAATVQQPFTTFTSRDHGGEWTDKPFYPPPNIGSSATGEHPQVTIDPFGFVYIGSLYAVPDGQGGFDSVIAAQNFTGISQINSAQNGIFSTKFIPSLVAKNEIKQFWYLYNSKADIMNMVWWEAPFENSNSGAASKSSGLANLELLQTEQQQATGDSGAIGIVWKDRKDYYAQDPEEIIQPCDSGTNPVHSGGFIYVGCRVGEGEFKWDPSVPKGTFVMFKFQPDTSNLTYLGRTPIMGGEAKIGARSDGRLALASAGAVGGELNLRVTYGSDRGGRIQWTNVDVYDDRLDRTSSNEQLREANIQQMIYREDSGVLHMVLKQVRALAGGGATNAITIAAPNIMKDLVAIDETHGVLAQMDLDIGNILNRTDPALLTAPEEVYNDISDGFLQLPMSPYTYNGRELGALHEIGGAEVRLYQREFFAVGDYGIVIFAEVIEITNLECACPPIPGSPPTPLPAPATSLTVTNVMVPAAGITIAGLMATSFAINRTKSHNAAAAKGKK